MLIEIATQNDQIASTLLCPPVSPSRLSVNFWTTVSEAVYYLIFVTTITTAGGVKKLTKCKFVPIGAQKIALYDSIATVGEIRVYWRADFQSGSRVLKKVF